MPLSSGRNFACAVRADGTLACWGGGVVGSSNPRPLPLPPSGTFSSVGVGDTHACALRTDGTAECWGASSEPPLTPPTGTFQQLETAAALVDLFGLTRDYACGLRFDGSMTCWGAIVR
jgi:alpha-tubulin suppressor-like RCC1 family protein